MVRRTRAEMEETRATLLATARKVFSERGYADTSMDDLTAQASLTRGALYHHFGDKKGLLAAVVEQIDAEMDERLRVISDTAEDAWDGFRHRCRAYLEMALEPEIQRIVLRDARASEDLAMDRYSYMRLLQNQVQPAPSVVLGNVSASPIMPALTSLSQPMTLSAPVVAQPIAPAVWDVEPMHSPQ